MGVRGIRLNVEPTRGGERAGGGGVGVKVSALLAEEIGYAGVEGLGRDPPLLTSSPRTPPLTLFARVRQGRRQSLGEGGSSTEGGCSEKSRAT